LTLIRIHFLFYFVFYLHSIQAVDMGEFAAGDVAAVGAGDAVREAPGRPLPCRGGRARNANLVLINTKASSVISY
jgi:hypothetical protein